MRLSKTKADSAIEGFLDFMVLCDPSINRWHNKRILEDIMIGLDLDKNILNTRPDTKHLTKYLILYLAVNKGLPMYTEVVHIMLVVNTLEKGGEDMKKSIYDLILGSKFLQDYFTKIDLKRYQWEFTDKEGKKFIVTLHGSRMTVRGTFQLGTRPRLAILHDLLTAEEYLNPSLVNHVDREVCKGVHYGLHPTWAKAIWTGFDRGITVNNPEFRGSGRWLGLRTFVR